MSSSHSRLRGRHHVRATIVVALLVAAAITADGQAPNLREAVRAGNTQAIRALLQKRVDVNVADPDGTTALHWAARNNDADTARALLKAGAKANAANTYGMTPLFLAATNGSAVIAQALLDAGADPNHIVTRGQTPLDDGRSRRQRGNGQGAAGQGREG